VDYMILDSITNFNTNIINVSCNVYTLHIMKIQISIYSSII